MHTDFSYAGNGPVEIVGAGRGQTVLTAEESSPASRVLYVAGGAGSSIHDLTIGIPPKAAQGYRGLLLSSAARRVECVEDPVQGAAHVGALLDNGAVLEDSSVKLSTEQGTTGVTVVSPVTGGMDTIRGSEITAKTGVTVGYVTGGGGGGAAAAAAA